MERRIITTDVIEEDLKTEGNLRPQALSRLYWSGKSKRKSESYIEAAKQRNDALDHVLFYGLQDLERQRLPGLLQMKWEFI